MPSRLLRYGRRGLGLRNTTPDGYVDIDVDLEDWQVRMLIASGMVTVEESDILKFTDEGNKWLREYCERVLEEHNAKL